MGDVIRLAERRAAREARSGQRMAPARVEFLFDLCCPFSYLAAERVDRIFDEVVWTPASTAALCCGSLATDPDGLAEYRLSAERRALELRLPLIWPERFPEDVPAAMRAAHYASEQGRGAAFVLAAGRQSLLQGSQMRGNRLQVLSRLHAEGSNQPRSQLLATHRHRLAYELAAPRPLPEAATSSLRRERCRRASKSISSDRIARKGCRLKGLNW